MAGVEKGKLEISEISEDDIVIVDEKAWVKIDVDEKIYQWNDKESVVIKFSSPCMATMDSDLMNLNAVLNQYFANKKADSENNTGTKSADKATAICGIALDGDAKQQIEQAQKALDANTINSLGYKPPAVKPAAAVIAMKSNVKNYGPYPSSNFGSSAGGIQVEVNADLCPWVFGSISAMNSAGTIIANSSQKGLVKAETGSATVPGLPTLTGVGAEVGGANLSNISFTYGSNGISTSYSFSTYTPKFGSLSRHMLDKLKNVAKNRFDQIKFLRTNQILQNKIGRKLRNIQRAQALIPNPQNTLQRVMVGHIYNWEKIGEEHSQRTIVGIDALGKSVNEMTYDYDKKAYMSLDGLFGPVSIAGAGGYLPRYSAFSVRDHKSSPEAPTPPCATGEQIDKLDINNLEITQKYSNPLTNPFSENEHHHDGGGKGHVVDILGRKSELPNDGLISNFKDLDDEARYDDDYRFLSLRGPLVLHSWGYDTNGKPIPNAADTLSETKDGKFKNESLQDKFAKDWLTKPNMWPAAPIDLRFDRERGVWVCPQGYKIIVGKLLEDLEPYSSCKALLVNKNTGKNQEYGKPIYGADGEEIEATEDETNSKAKIKVADRIGKKFKKGSLVYCYYDTYNSEYIIVSSESSETAIRFKLIDKCSSSSSAPDYGDDWTKFAGYNDKFPNKHILGVRIDCDGNPIDKDGNIISESDLDDNAKASNIYVNLYDNTGCHGPAYAKYTTFDEWKNRAFNGIAVSIVKPSGSDESQSSQTNCSLGDIAGQCSSVNTEYSSFDIVFLESYARFIECTLQQDLYASDTKLSSYAGDTYKQNHPKGNAKAYLKNYYGNNVNGKEPKFYQENGDEVEIRVFDPFFEDDIPKAKNPFYKLKENDKVLAIFDEKNKKYIIYQSLVDDSGKVIKFALANDKDLRAASVLGVRVNAQNLPIDDQGNLIQDQETFNANLIELKDPYRIKGPGLPVDYTTFGPALGSNQLAEHQNGIALSDASQETIYMPPFVGFALKRSVSSESQSSSSGEEYEIIALEHFAHYVTGKIGTPTNSYNNKYLAVRKGYSRGRKPITRKTQYLPNKFDLIVDYQLTDFTGEHSYIVGDIIDQPQGTAISSYDNVDGCEFVAELDTSSSDPYELVYTIIDAEHVALVGDMKFKLDDLTKAANLANLLNTGQITIIPPNEADADIQIDATFSQGFMWDSVKSKTKYGKTTIVNREDWKNLALIVPGSAGVGAKQSQYRLELQSMGLDGSLTYKITTGSTIANFVVRPAITNGGVFGTSALPANIAEVQATDKFNIGIETGSLPENTKPQIRTIGDNHQYMSFDGATAYTFLYQDGATTIAANKYTIVNMQEAPTIITGKAAAKFKPEDNKDISIKADFFASSQGIDKEPVVGLMKKIENPMGYGAEIDDIVTVQRVHSNQLITVAGDVLANYKYIVIGTSSPPKK